MVNCGSFGTPQWCLSSRGRPSCIPGGRYPTSRRQARTWVRRIGTSGSWPSGRWSRRSVPPPGRQLTCKSSLACGDRRHPEVVLHLLDKPVPDLAGSGPVMEPMNQRAQHAVVFVLGLWHSRDTNGVPCQEAPPEFTSESTHSVPVLRVARIPRITLCPGSAHAPSVAPPLTGIGTTGARLPSGEDRGMALPVHEPRHAIAAATTHDGPAGRLLVPGLSRLGSGRVLGGHLSGRRLDNADP